MVNTRDLARRVLEIRSLLWQDRPFNGADLQADSAINAGGKINPIPVGAFGIFARTFVNTGNRTGVHAVRDAFTGIRYNRMGHSVLSYKSAANPFYRLLADSGLE